MDTQDEDVLAKKANAPFIEKGNGTEGIPSVCSQRWILAFLFLTGYFFVYSLRVNISVALVCMVKTPFDNSSIMTNSMIKNSSTLDNQCGEVEMKSKDLNERAEFDWDKSTKSSILASFFYGYIITQIPGGWLADRYGGRRVFGIAMAISGICTLLMPVCARTSVILVYVIRVILGLATGVVFPAGHSMWGRWAPRLERTKLVATSQVGAWFGTIATFASSGLLCEYGFDNGWASIFYITGGLCCVWVVVWFIQAGDSPSEHPRISDVERDYILNNIEFDIRERTSKVPWKRMLKSVPLWATVTAHVCANWTNYTLITSLPAFMKGVLKFDIKSNGALSAVPYICAAVMSLAAGHMADFIRGRGILTTTQTRKVFQCSSFIGAAIFLVSTGFVPCTKRDVAVGMLCLAVLSTGLSRAGFAVNHIDIAPKYAGICLGITNTLATIPGMISPIVAGALTPNDTAEEWRNVFYVSAAFFVFGTIIFGAFSSGVLQPWAVDNDDHATDGNKDNNSEMACLNGKHIE